MTRPAVTLSREMKILLTALGLVALLGGWMVLNNRQASDTDVVQPPVTSAKADPATATVPANGSGATGSAGNSSGAGVGTNPSGTGSNGSGSNDTGIVTPTTPSTTASGSGSVQVGTEGKTEVATVPPFPVTGPNGTTPDPTIVAAVPRGINPNQPLNGLNGNNPFRPVRIEAKGGTPAGALVTTPARDNGSGTVGTGAVTITRPTTPPSAIDSALGNPSTGALPISPIAGADTTPPQGFGGSSESGLSSGTRSGTGNSASGGSRGGNVTTTTGGAFPPPTLPGIPAGNGVTVVGASPAPTGSGNAPTTTIKVPGSGSTGNSASGAGSASVAAPVRPPLAGVREPGTVSVPGASTASGTKGAASSAGGVNAAPAGELSNPAVMTDLGGGTGTAPATSPLEASISEHQLVFDAAVLGPVNTAVFRSDKGYVVATVGDTIPNTNIVLKEVTANSATLAVGNDRKILELDKR